MGDAGAFDLANGPPMSGSSSGDVDTGRGAGAGAPAASLASCNPSRANKIRTEDEWRMALNALVGQEIYVYGTGSARELRQDGVLRKVPAAARSTARVRGPVEVTARAQVGDQVRVESRGTLMGFNEFCASAQNSKKRPRQTIHMAGTGLSLKQVRGSGSGG